MPDIYSSHVFDVANLDDAKFIILTPEEDGNTDERWEKETPWFVDLCLKHLDPAPGKVLLDYGCGIGRIARELIRQTGCFVVGVDISPSMRALGNVYVNSPGFITCAPEALSVLGIKADAAIAAWVIQHCRVPGRDVKMIEAAMKPDAPLMVLNNNLRAVPTLNTTWAVDRIDVAKLLSEVFDIVGPEGAPPAEVAPPSIQRNTYWRLYRRRR